MKNKYERYKEAMLKLAVKKKIKRLGYNIVGYDYVTEERVIEFICTDEKTKELIFINLVTKKTPDFYKREICTKEDYLNTNIVREMEWFKKNHEFMDYKIRLDGIEGYVGTKKVQLKYFKNILEDKEVI